MKSVCHQTLYEKGLAPKLQEDYNSLVNWQYHAHRIANTQRNHYNTGSTTASCVCEGEQHETSDNVSERPLERDTTSRGLQSCPVPDPVTPARSPAIPPLSSGRDQEGMTVPDPTTSPVMILPHSSPMSAVTFPSGSLTFPHSPVMAPFPLQLDSSHDCNTGAK